MDGIVVGGKQRKEAVDRKPVYIETYDTDQEQTLKTSSRKENQMFGERRQKKQESEPKSNTNRA